MGSQGLCLGPPSPMAFLLRREPDPESQALSN